MSSDATSHLWSEGQKQAYCELIEVADLFFATDWADFPIKPRLVPLIVGPSGMGKSHLIREVAKEYGLPILRLTPSNWIVAGAAKENTPTLLRIHQFLTENDQGIIHFDELDKFGVGHTDWSRYVIGELFDLLDRCPSQPAKEMVWSSDIIRKLKYDFFIVGTGTWQQLWSDASKAKVGFGGEDSGDSLVARVRHAVECTDAIPQELLRRFNRQLIILPPASQHDYQNAAGANGLTRIASELKTELDFASAAQSGLGARWLEEEMGRLLLLARKAHRSDLLGLRGYVPEVQDEKETGSEDEPDDLFVGDWGRTGLDP